MPNSNSPFKQNFKKSKVGPGLSKPSDVAKSAEKYKQENSKGPVLRSNNGYNNKKPQMVAGNKNPALGGGMSYTDMVNS